MRVILWGAVLAVAGVGCVDVHTVPVDAPSVEDPGPLEPWQVQPAIALELDAVVPEVDLTPLGPLNFRLREAGVEGDFSRVSDFETESATGEVHISATGLSIQIDADNPAANQFAMNRLTFNNVSLERDSFLQPAVVTQEQHIALTTCGGEGVSSRRSHEGRTDDIDVEVLPGVERGSLDIAWTATHVDGRVSQGRVTID